MFVFYSAFLFPHLLKTSAGILSDLPARSRFGKGGKIKHSVVIPLSKLSAS
jgi:hypothetical protein